MEDKYDRALDTPELCKGEESPLFLADKLPEVDNACAILTEELSDQDPPMLLAYNNVELPLFLADKRFSLYFQQLVLNACVILAEDRSDQDLPMLLAYNNVESPLFLVVEEQALYPHELFCQPFLLVELNACVILMEDQSDQDPPMLLAYNNEESPLFLVLVLVPVVAVAVPFLNLAPPSETLIPNPLLPGVLHSLSLRL
jgi:hypothetical protein